VAKDITIRVFEYDELDDKAQAKARDWYRRASEGDNYFAESVIEDAVRMAEIIGIEIAEHRETYYIVGQSETAPRVRTRPAIWWQLGYMQSDGVWIEATIRHAPYGNIKIREEAPKDETLHAIADRLQAVHGEYEDRLVAVVKDSDRGPMDLDVELSDHTEECTRLNDASATERCTCPEITAETYKELRAIVRDFSQWIYNNLRAEHEYQDSDDAIAENIRANEYTFRADGTRFDG
jgi:hypothetical protein